MMRLAAIWLALLVQTEDANSLERGARALKEFRAESALKYLELARNEGPYSYEQYVRLHEQLGVAYAYLGRKKSALREFATVLVLAPGHAISYTLSPKVTFLFEKARQQATGQVATTVDLSWERDLEVDSAVPIDVEVVADPLGLLSRAQLNFRARGTQEFQSLPLGLPALGERAQAEIPSVAEDSEEGAALEIYLSAFDKHGNEVLRWGSSVHPREIALHPAESWYDKWWVWTIVGGAVAAGTGVAVFLATQEPSAMVEGSFEVGP